ncbi:MAG: RNA polymerase factor sigma-54 [Deltaproteobacteria bacterium]
MSRRLQQTLVITPQLKHAIKILQLSRADLETLVTEEMEQNPTIEEVGVGQEDFEAEADTRTPDERMGELTDPVADRESSQTETPEQELAPEDSQINDINWEEYLADYANNSTQGSMSAGAGGDWDENRPSLENTLARDSSLADHLTWQLRMAGFREEHQAIGDILIGNVDENGYLRMTLEEVAFEAGVELATAESVRRRLQDFDPSGVFAVDLRECLLIQLRESEADEKVCKWATAIVDQHMGLLESRRIDKIAKELKVTKEEAGEAVSLIATLEPKPGRNFVTEEPRYVTPDVFVYRMDDEWVVQLNDDGMPRLRVSNSYRRLLTGPDSGAEAKSYIREKLSAAQWLIKSIQQRQSTLFRVTTSIIRFQADFLDHGVKALRPLVLKDVAAEIGMHESTVSRATANKYVHTPQGTLELKYFFTSSIRTSMGGEGVSAEAVKEKIKGIIEGENPRRPCSDQHIAETLAIEGVEIARRTVAKYRELMGILPSSKRRQMI